MAITKKVIALALALGLIAAGAAGIQYYYDNIKLPDISPRQVFEQYFEAVKRKDYEKAYSFVSLQHFRYSFNQFKDRVDMYSPNMRLEILGEIIEKDAALIEAKTYIPMTFGLYASDTRMKLVRVKREWKIIHP